MGNSHDPPEHDSATKLQGVLQQLGHEGLLCSLHRGVRIVQGCRPVNVGLLPTMLSKSKRPLQRRQQTPSDSNESNGAEACINVGWIADQMPLQAHLLGFGAHGGICAKQAGWVQVAAVLVAIPKLQKFGFEEIPDTLSALYGSKPTVRLLWQPEADTPGCWALGAAGSYIVRAQMQHQLTRHQTTFWADRDLNGCQGCCA